MVFDVIKQQKLIQFFCAFTHSNPL